MIVRRVRVQGFWPMLRIGLLVLGMVAPLAAQEGFGFGDETEEAPGGSGGFSFISGARVSGEVSAQLLGYGDDFTSSVTLKETTLGDVFSGKLNFSASGSNAEAVINLNLAPVFDGSASPVAIDEAYLRAYFGGFTIEGGLRKLTWGKADSLGPLDVVNPLDYSDLTSMTDIMGRKIARPMIHASYSFGSFSKLEGVFVPWFEGHRFAHEGRWAPSQLTTYPEVIRSGIDGAIQGLPPQVDTLGIHEDILTADGLQKINDHYANLDIPSFYPETSTLKYAQAGLRFTTTIASSDIGVQYYFGRLPRPAITVTGMDTFLQNPYGITPTITYNWYHQIGLDYAQVIAGFNLRAELAGNITGDSAG
ncbi:MAG: hypothetical protein LBT13_03200, partial [Treponema sp.]|nr:hypothetical protein [Treponema sp.]